MQTVFIFHRKATARRGARSLVVYDLAGMTYREHWDETENLDTLHRDVTRHLRATVRQFYSMPFNVVIVPVNSAKMDQLDHATTAKNY